MVRPRARRPRPQLTVAAAAGLLALGTACLITFLLGTEPSAQTAPTWTELPEKPPISAARLR